MNLLKTKQFNRIGLVQSALTFLTTTIYGTQLKQCMLSLFLIMHFNLVTDPPQVLQTHKEKAAPFCLTKIVSRLLSESSN